MREGLDLSRRQILAGLAVGLVVPVPSLASAPPVHAFVHESGKPGQSGAFVLGGLFTADPERLADALAAARRRTGFFAPLRHSATDRFKTPYARAAVDALLHNPSARFVVHVAPGWPSDAAQRRAAYSAAYVSLLREAGDGIVLHKPAHRTLGPDAALDRHLAAHASVRAASGMGGDIAQLAAFLTGSVAASRHDLRSRVKAELVGHVMARLEASSRFSVMVA